MTTRLKRRVNPRKRQRGFTLVELLVVITIIGMLMALLFPAMSGVMDTVKMTQCSKALSSIGVALTNYKTNNQSNQNAWPVVSSKPVDCPPAAVPTGTRKQNSKQPEAGYSWIVKILPYVEETTLFNSISQASDRFKAPAFSPQVSETSSAGVKSHYSTRPLKFLKCPGFDLPMISGAPEYTTSDFAGEGTGVGLTNFVAISATHLDMVFNTNVGARAKPNAMTGGPNGTIIPGVGTTNIGDGPSKTIVAVETREPNYASWMDGTTTWVVGADPNRGNPSLSTQGTRRVVECVGDCQHALNVGPADNAAVNYRSKDVQNARWQHAKADWQYGPSSMHAGGINHLFGDSHVTSIPATVDSTVYMQLITIRGGDTPQGY